jgi:UDP-glucuronate 4-epimerase
MKILVTGSAGFIGFHVAQFLIARGDTVVGIDNFNSYYDPSLKEARNSILEQTGSYSVERLDMADAEAVLRVITEEKPDAVCHLAAQAGVRYSLENPQTYIQSNLLGFVNLLEAMQKNSIRCLVYASSSSVYGKNTKTPFSVADAVDCPISLYAATKKSNELMAHVYHHLYGLSCTGLRFFTVYGPWGRPDMAMFKFTRAIVEGKPIDVYNHGDMERDFTYIDDIVAGTIAAIDTPQDHEVLNIGQGRPEKLMTFIDQIESSLGVVAEKNFLPMQPGDVPRTYADTSAIERLLNYKPSIPISEGVPKFIDWYIDYYGIKGLETMNNTDSLFV